MSLGQDPTGAAQVKQAHTENDQMTKTNLTNFILNQMARGGTIDSATALYLGLPASVVGKASSVLPYYMSGIESKMGLAAGTLSKAIQGAMGTPLQEMAKYQSDIDANAPGIDASRNFAQDIATGAETGKMLDEAGPTFDARTAAATGKRNSALESLKQTLNELDMAQSKRGFSSGSGGNNMLRFQARRAIEAAGSDDISGARLMNAQEGQAIRGAGRTMRLANINLPSEMATADIGRRGLPGTAAASRFSTSLAPLAFFNTGPHPYSPFAPMPAVAPQGSAIGMFGAANMSALSSAGRIGANYAANRTNSLPPPTRGGANPYANAADYSAADAAGMGDNYNPDMGGEMGI